MEIIECTNKDIVLDHKTLETCDRHIRLFGPVLQKKLASLTIGIVGAGGTGSIITEQLMRLYPGKIIIIDDDKVEHSNLNRLTNSIWKDAEEGAFKVEVAHRAIKAFNPVQDVDAINGNILDIENQKIFTGCDIIFGAVDSPGPRFVLNQLCLAHGIPYIDCGTGVILENKEIKHVGGQIIIIFPDSGGCLYCSGLFNRKDAMEELLSKGEHSRLENMGYIRGANITAPQVYALNMMVSSMAIWIFMRLISGERFEFNGLTIDARNLTMTYWKIEDHNNKDCPVCGEHGIIFKGDEADFLCREKDGGTGDVISF